MIALPRASTIWLWRRQSHVLRLLQHLAVQSLFLGPCDRFEMGFLQRQDFGVAGVLGVFRRRLPFDHHAQLIGVRE